ncbi:MAG: HlyD family efflux transporter periplasmic adaptor subunit [bacterium]|nr:HlyD family efflux transporter periplasmic adaptor subunit [bacterium]
MSNLPKPKKKRFYKKWWFWTLIILVLSGAGLASVLSQQYADAQLNAYSYLEDNVEVKRRNISKTISTNGHVVPDNSTYLFFSIPGEVTAIDVNVGDNVDKDKVLMRIDGGDFTRSGNDELKSPFDGKVLSINTFVGDVINQTTAVMEIGYRSNHIEFIASESEVIDLRTGQRTTITVPSYNNGRDEYDGEVTFVDVKKQVAAAGAQATSGAVAESGYLVKVSTTEMPDEIRDIIGLSVDLIVDIYETSQVNSLKLRAIQHDDDDNPYVYLVPEINPQFISDAMKADSVTDLLETKDITTGFEGNDYIEITSGLKDGDKVLLYTPNGISDSGGIFN